MVIIILIIMEIIMLIIISSLLLLGIFLSIPEAVKSFCSVFNAAFSTLFVFAIALSQETHRTSGHSSSF